MKLTPEVQLVCNITTKTTLKSKVLPEVFKFIRREFAKQSLDEYPLFCSLTFLKTGESVESTTALSTEEKPASVKTFGHYEVKCTFRLVDEFA